MPVPLRVVRIVATALVAAAPLRAQVLVGISPSGVAAPLGGRSTVPVVADVPAGQAVGAFQFTVSWNPAVLRYVGHAPGGFGAVTVNDASATAGALEVAGADAQGGSGLAVLVQLTFEMLADTGSSPISVGNLDLTQAGTFAPLAGAAAPGAFCAHTGRYGDLDRNGTILGNDALILVTAAVGLPIAPYTLVNGDVDGDGRHDTRDALVVLSHAVGLATPGFRAGQENTGSCAVVAVSALDLAPLTLDLAPGDEFPLEPRARDAAGRRVAVPGLVWTSSDPSAAVDSAGRVRSVSVGSAVITARALGGPTASATVVSAPRREWHVDPARAAAAPRELGSSLYPFSSIQQALDAAAAGDTVRVAAGATYAPVTITRAVTVIGDSGAAGMPLVKNGSGPAIVSRAAGRVVLRRLEMRESVAGLEASGDSLDVQSLAAQGLRGPAFRIHGMLHARLAGVSGRELLLAGVFADSTRVLEVSGADFRFIQERGDSVAGVAVLAADSLVVADLRVFGLIGDGGPSAVIASLVERVRLTRFDLRGAIEVDGARHVAIRGGTVRRTAGTAVSLQADTAVLDTVSLLGVGGGIALRPVPAGPLAVARISAGVIDSVFGSAAVVAGDMAALTIENTDIRHVPNGAGVLVTPAAALVIRGGRIGAAAHEAVRTDAVDTVALVGLTVDSSAAPDLQKFGASRFAVVIRHADSVRLDTLAVVDNAGGGILVDSARVVTARGGTIARNRGEAGSGSCDGPCPNLAAPRAHGDFSTGAAPGVTLAMVQDARIAASAFDSNERGAREAWMDILPAPALTIDSSRFRGGRAALVRVYGNLNALEAAVTIRGGEFRAAGAAVDARDLRSFVLTGARLDSVPTEGGRAVALQSVGDVVLAADTLSDGLGGGIEISGARTLTVSGLVARRFAEFCPECGGTVFFVSGITDSALFSGARFEANKVTSLRFEAGTGTMIVDSSVVADQAAGSGVMLFAPVTLRRTLLTRNGTAVLVGPGGEPSTLVNNNFAGNTAFAVSNTTATQVVASNNWWNDPLGPSGCSACNTGSAGDPVSELVIFDPPLPAPFGEAPAAAPRSTGGRR